MKIAAICCTHGRHYCLERAVGMFLQQDYEDKILFIHNNSSVPLKMDREYDNIILVNKHLNSNGKKYSTLGDIYTHTLQLIEENNIQPDVAAMYDDDDLYLPNHLSEGVKGYKKAMLSGKLAYKPQKSYYRHSLGVTLMENTLEPSIFVSYAHLKQYGFSKETTAQHLQWVDPLVYENKILVDPDTESTLIYNWGDGAEIPTFKTSGDPYNPNNFSNYRAFSTDNGDGIISPLSLERLTPYYNLVS